MLRPFYRDRFFEYNIRASIPGNASAGRGERQQRTTVVVSPQAMASREQFVSQMIRAARNRWAL